MVFNPTLQKRTELIENDNKYVIAETKFLTDFGGHQNDQFEDAGKWTHYAVK